MKSSSDMKDLKRRNFLRKIVALTASAGLAGLLLDRLPGKSVIQPVQAVTAMNIDTANVGTSTTSLSSPGNPALTGTNTGSGAGLQGTCTAGTGVLGTTTSGTGVQGTASAAAGVALAGFASAGSAIPIVAQGAVGQTANLQEWRSGSGGALSIVDPNGSLAIGATVPAFPLHVQSTGNAVIIIKGPGDVTRMQMQNTGTGGGDFTFSVFKNTINPPGGFGITDEIAGVNRFVIDASGNCGVGTAFPAFKLDVAGACHATSFPTSSDTRFKEDVQPIDNALDKILRLNGVYFKWNHLHRETLKRSHTMSNRQVGLIAQQVREVVPELVSEWADEGANDYLAVDYGRLAAITIEAIKQLTERLEVIERKLAAS